MAVKPGHVTVWRKWLRSEESSFWLLSIDPELSQRIICHEKPGSNRVKAEIVTRNSQDALRIQKDLGGNILRLSPKIWWAPQVEKTDAIQIKNKLLVVTNEKARRYWKQKHPECPIIVIPQGLAFGSGTHSTTKMCLQALGKIKIKIDKETRMLDAGTGSGILAIASSKLGITNVVAFDNDPIAVRVARENARVNKARIVCKVSDLGGKFTRNHYHIVTANLFSELLVTHENKISSWVKKGGYLILSGIKKEQARQVKAAYRRHQLIDERTTKGWVCLVYRA